jgi:hypothetical protein
MNPGYITAEKHWLKKHWRGEFHFLIAYGLKIYNEEDREEGRAIVRAFMKAEEPESSGFNTTNKADKVGKTLSSHQYGEIEDN